jgi:Ser/Thr protein kinase RdoA (MazF antagonist)
MDGATYALSLRSSHYTHAALESEMRWLEAMQDAPSVRVPAPVPALDGRLVCSLTAPELSGTLRCTLCRWLPGHERDEASLTRSEFERLGRAAGALHEKSFRFAPPADFTRPTWDEHRFHEYRVANTYDQILAHVRRYFSAPKVEHFARITDQALQRMRALSASPGARGLVHGDFHAGNYLFDGEARGEGDDDRVAFVDFEDLGWGYASYDIATALFGAMERPDHAELVDAFARGYAARRRLPADFALELRLFQVIRTLFLTSLVVTTGDLGESRWWEGYVVGKLERLLDIA